MRLTLKDVGFPYMKIMRGRVQVGRTYKAADGTYTCQMHGKPVFTGAADHQEAFREGAARYFGADRSEDLRQRNAAARARQRAMRAEAQHVAHDMLSRDPVVRNAAFDKLFRGMKR